MQGQDVACHPQITVDNMVRHDDACGIRAALGARDSSASGRGWGDSDLSASSIAIRFGITPRYVARLFEREGTIFTAFMLEQRLCHARSLLEDSSRAEISVSAIALASGFGDISYFNKCFRRRYGMTPSDAGLPRQSLFRRRGDACR